MAIVMNFDQMYALRLGTPRVSPHRFAVEAFPAVVLLLVTRTRGPCGVVVGFTVRVVVLAVASKVGRVCLAEDLTAAIDLEDVLNVVRACVVPDVVRLSLSIPLSCRLRPSPACG